jgi:hypothetical protein
MLPYTSPLMRVVPRGADAVGLVVSATCAVQCLATPVLATAVPFMAAEDGVENVILTISAIVAVWSTVRGCLRHHGRLVPVFVMAAGFGLILLGRASTGEGSPLEMTTVVAGASLVASSHILNWRLCCGAVPRRRRL